jgi:hypothetical protein
MNGIRNTAGCNNEIAARAAAVPLFSVKNLVFSMDYFGCGFDILSIKPTRS